MSLSRLVFYSAVVGGWSAFVGWLLAQLLFGRWVDVSFLLVALMVGIVAAFIGGGLSQVAGLINLRWGDQVHRLGPGIVGGLAGGIAGALLGSLIHAMAGEFGRVIGWAFMGIGIGVAEGIYEQSPRKLRNGLIGGALGGFLGGLLFFLFNLIGLGTDVSKRATGFVILGVCIGLFIGLVQVVLKEAWLTVEQGFRPGRQLILAQPLLTLGTSEKASLIFIAYGAKGVEPIHLQIQRLPDGRYVVQDNQSRTGTFVNGQRLSGPALLRDGDRLQFGTNVVRFNERVRSAAGVAAPVAAVPAKPAPVMGIPVTAARPAQVVPVAAVPVPLPPPPAKPPPPPPRAVPAQPVSQPPLAGVCPVCEWKGSGIPGRRKCENCGAVF